MPTKVGGLIYDLPSQEYHSMGGSFSSSQMKDMLKDPELFYKKYIEKTIEKEENSVFDVGTYFHTLVLEPHLIKDEVRVFKGIRRGKEWEEFKKLNSGKLIITENDKETGDKLAEAVRNSPISMNFIKRAKYEVSAFVDILFIYGEMFSVDGKKRLDPEKGWVPSGIKVDAKKAIKLVFKCRADALLDSGQKVVYGNYGILDLKSTSGIATSDEEMKSTTVNYNYDLSAAMYLDVFSLATGDNYTDFLWTYASKSSWTARTYAADPMKISIGRAKWMKAANLLASYIANDWKFTDSLGIIGPMKWEYDILKPKDEDLL